MIFAEDGLSEKFPLWPDQPARKGSKLKFRPDALPCSAS